MLQFKNREVCIENHTTPMTKREILELYSYETAMCKIKCQVK